MGDANSVAMPFTMRLIERFPANYELSFDQELPSSGGEVFQFVPGDDERDVHGIDGPLMEVQPRIGTRWLGIFGNGYKGAVVDAAFTTPSPDVLCIVANGAGYWLNTVTRKKSNVQAFPIRQVEIVGERMLFCDFTRLACYDSGGFAWRTDSLVSDNLRIIRADAKNDRIECAGWNAPGASEIRISLRLATGDKV
jgi:hypothetical protein